MKPLILWGKRFGNLVPVKLLVWWGSIYAKIAYASLAGLIGYGVKVATDD